MDTQQIVALLIAERDRLTQAIAALQGNSSATGIKKLLPNKKTRRTRTPEQKAAQAEKMRAYWAARKKTAKKRSKA